MATKATGEVLFCETRLPTTAYSLAPASFASGFTASTTDLTGSAINNLKNKQMERSTIADGRFYRIHSDAILRVRWM